MAIPGGKGGLQNGRLELSVRESTEVHQADEQEGKAFQTEGTASTKRKL